ncbi:hypothetical protein D3C78_833370 [compost metagenome]
MWHFSGRKASGENKVVQTSGFLLGFDPVRHTATADQYNPEFRQMAKFVSYLNEGFDRLRGPQVSGKNQTEMVVELREQGCGNPGLFDTRRYILIRVWVIHDLARIGVTGDRLSKCPRLNKKRIDEGVNTFHQPAHNAQYCFVLDEPGRTQALRPEILNPYSQMTLEFPLQVNRRNY